MNCVEPTVTWTHEEGSACKHVLHSKKGRVKFKEDMIIVTEFLNREKVFLNFRHM
ncbi:hypothetical protein Hanom_Chr01g00082211 [Helianthus anomalus]